MKKLALALTALAAIAAHASDRVGTLENVTGPVSVGGAGVVAKAANGSRLVDGNTVLVSSSGKATVVLFNGCAISLMGSQHLTVDSKLPCDQILASVKNLSAPVRTAQALISDSPVRSAGPAAAGGAGAAGAGTTTAVGLGSEIAAIGALSLGITALVLQDARQKSSGS